MLVGSPGDCEGGARFGNHNGLFRFLGRSSSCLTIYGDSRLMWLMICIEYPGLGHLIWLWLRVIRGVNIVGTHAWCQHHSTDCEYPDAELHIAGPPCVDWSLMGQRKGKDGPTYKHYATWCGMRRRRREKAVLMENVPCACFSSMGIAVFRFFFAWGSWCVLAFPQTLVGRRIDAPHHTQFR